MNIEENRIASADKVELKPFFVKRYKQILGDRYDEYMKYSFTYLRKCIRVNTLKVSVGELRKRLEDQGWVLVPIPWCPQGFFVEGHKDEHRFDIGNVIEHTLGYFYVQESASMLPPLVLFSNDKGRFIAEDVANQDCSKMRVLDICAAPGSKTTQLAQYMNNQGLLIANDVDVTRLKPLTLNLQRMGVNNFLVTMNAFQKNKQSERPRNPFWESHPKGFFDRVLVDAPCSGTGTIRRSFKSLSMYSEGLVKRLSSIQKRLIQNAFIMLKPGGVLIYSTCTQEPLENEAIVTYLLSRNEDAQVMPIDLNIVKSEPITEFNGDVFHEDVKHCLRIYPQDNNSEGFFVCKIKKLTSVND